MELLQAHGAAMEEFGRRVHQVRPEQWHSRTPCTEWDVRTLVNHLVSEQLWAPHILAGHPLEEAGDRFDGDQLGSDPISAWDRAAERAREAFLARGALEGTVHLSYGADDAVAYAWQMTCDLAIHAWDLACGLGGPQHLDEQLLAAVHDRIAPQVEILADTGLFAPPVPVPEDAPLQARTLAMVGRRQ